MKIKTAITTLIFILSISLNSFAATRVVLQLNWKYQFEFAGYIAAKEKGFYKDAGLNVTIKEYKGGNVINDVLNGKATFGVVGNEIFSSAVLGQPVVFLANFFKHSPLVLAVKPSILSPAGLNNKTIIANKNGFKFSSLALLIKMLNIKPKNIILINGTYSVKPFIKGKVDAIAIYLTDESYQLNKLHVKYNIIDPSNYGILSYAGNLFTSKRELKKHPEIVRRFVGATKRGWKYALNHKKEIINIIYDKYSKKKSIGALTFEANAIESIVMPHIFPIGYIDKNVVKNILNNVANIMKSSLSNVNLNSFLYKPSMDSFFNKQDLYFIKKHRIIRICTNPDWVPIEYLKNGEPKGISIGVLRRLQRITGLRFVRVPTKSWAESQEFLKKKLCDLLPSAIKTKKREQYALFTKPYMHYELFIFAKNNKSFVNGIEALLNKPMARKRGSGLITKLKNMYRKIDIVETNSYKQDFEYVQNGKAYYTVATLPVADYYIRKYNFKDIVIIGDSGIGYDLRMAVRKDMPTLVDILNKSLNKISKNTIDRIYIQQISNIATTKYNRVIAKILIVFSAFLLLLFAIIYFIQRTNKKLHNLTNRLKESLNNFEILINSTIQAIIIYKNNICIDANNVACKMLGYDKRELVGKNVIDLFSDKYKNTVLEKMKEEHSQPYEVEFVKKDGSIVYALAKGNYITINGEKVRVGSAVDITRIKQLQRALNELNKTLEKRIAEEIEKNRQKDALLMQQSKLASMGEMLSMIAHQWRQPLNTISANINTLLLKAELDTLDNEFLKEKLNAMSEYVKHLSTTIDDFRNFFRPDKEKDKIGIENIILDTLKIAKEHIESKNIRIILDLKFKGEIYTYANELKHVLLNLINNARDAILENRILEPYIKIVAYKQENNVFIKVQDNARGIKQEILDRIFKPYFTTKSNDNGTGLGLYMSKIIVEGHMGGKIYANNTEEGAEFTIVLPSE